MHYAQVLNENFVIKQVDTKQVFKIGLSYDDGSVPDLTGATATLYIADKNGVIATKEMDNVAEEEGVVSFSLDDGDITESGSFDVEVVITYSDGKRETFPDTNYLNLKVMPNLSSRGSAS